MSVAREIMAIRAMRAVHREISGALHEIYPIYSELSDSRRVLMIGVDTDLVRSIAMNYEAGPTGDPKKIEWWLTAPTRENWYRFYGEARFFLKKVAAFPNDKNYGGKVHDHR